MSSTKRSSLLVNGDGWTIGHMADINDKGQIVGIGYIGDSGCHHAILLSPVPEVSSLLAVLAGLELVVGNAKFRCR